MITPNDLISIGIIRRTHYKDLPPFVFVQRDGLFVPFRSENISELIGEEGFVLKSGNRPITRRDARSCKPVTAEEEAVTISSSTGRAEAYYSLH